jgi:hypothetical protein
VNIVEIIVKNGASSVFIRDFIPFSTNIPLTRFLFCKCRLSTKEYTDTPSTTQFHQRMRRSSTRLCANASPPLPFPPRPALRPGIGTLAHRQHWGRGLCHRPIYRHRIATSSVHLGLVSGSWGSGRVVI